MPETNIDFSWAKELEEKCAEANDLLFRLKSKAEEINVILQRQLGKGAGVNHLKS